MRCCERTGSLDPVESTLVRRAFGPRGRGAFEIELTDRGREEVEVTEVERGTGGGTLESGLAVVGEVKGDSMMVEGVRFVESMKREGRYEMGGVGREEGVSCGEVEVVEVVDEPGGYECCVTGGGSMPR